jgi:zinc protease
MTRHGSPTLSASINYYTDYAKNINTVTRADIQNYVRAYIKGKPSVTGLLVSPKMQEKLKIESFDSIIK